MKVQIDIRDKSAYFTNVPEDYKEFSVLNFGYMGAWLMGVDKNGKQTPIERLPHGKFEAVGFVKDVIVDKKYKTNINKNFLLRII